MAGPESIGREEDEVNPLDKVDAANDNQEEPPKEPDRLSQSERMEMRNGATAKDIEAKRKQLKETANSKLEEMIKRTELKLTLDDLKQYRNLLEGATNKEEIEDIQKEINAIPEQKAKEEAEAANDNVEIGPETEESQEMQKEVDKLCKENVKYIGQKQVDSWSEWFKSERNKSPKRGHLKHLMECLKGEKIQHKDGLYPRKVEYGNLDALFKNYGMDPLDSNWIKNEGLSERTEFRKNGERLQNLINEQKGLNFYSKEAEQNFMKDILTARNPAEQERLISQFQQIKKLEGKNYVELGKQTTINGVTLDKVSKESQKFLLDYYQNTQWDERLQMAKDWEGIIKNEVKLAEDFGALYKNADRKEFVEALGNFNKMNFLDKQNHLELHKKLTTENKEDKEKADDIKQACKNSINNAVSLKIFSKKTAKLYEQFFDDYKSPKTGKEPNSEEFMGLYKKLTDPNPDKKARNIAAYKEQKDEFVSDLNKYKESESHDPKKANKMMKDFDQTGWTKREKMHNELSKELKKVEKADAQNKEAEKVAGIEENNLKNKENQESLEKSEVLKAAKEMIDEQPAEALSLLLEYNKQDPDDPDVVFWMEVAMKRIKEFGSGEQKAESNQKQIEEEVEKELASEANQEKIYEEQLKTLNLEGAEMNEKRHNNKTDNTSRAREESLANVESGSEEEQIIEDFYDMEEADQQSEETYILDEEGKGKKVEEINFDSENEMNLNDQEKANLENITFEEQNKLDTNEGFTHVKLKDKSGNIMKAEQAKRQQEQELDKFTDQVAEDSLKKVERKSGGANIIDLQARIAAKRKAREKIDQKRFEKIS